MNDDRRDDDIRDEVEFHLAEEQDELEARGITSADARWLALRRFGSVARVQEDMRDVWVARWARELRQDIRFGVRSLARTPGFTTATLLCLVLGIGATTTVLSVARPVVFSNLPYPDADRLVAVYEQRPREGVLDNSVSYADFFDWRDRNRVFSASAAWERTNTTFSYTGDGDPEWVPGALVTAGFFDVLGVPLRAGRVFDRADENGGAPRVVIVSDRFWRRALGGDVTALGKVITLDRRPHSVVGILPEAFEAPHYRWELFVPLQFDADARGNRANHSLTVIARMRREVSLAQARADMDTISKALEAEHRVNQGHYANVVPMVDAMRGDLRPSALALLGAAGLVLLIACFNVANLLLARAVTRVREISVRMALGAGRSRIVRQLLTESVVLSCLGAAGGVLLALAGVLAIRQLTPASEVLNPHRIRLDPFVLGATTLVALVTGLAFGLAPALSSRRQMPAEMLRVSGDRSSTPARSWYRSAIVVAEAALAVTLLVSAGLLLRSFWELQSVNPGFRAEGVLTLQLRLPPGYESPSSKRAFQEELLGRIRALPGITDAGLTSFLPMSGADSRQGLVIEGIEPDRSLGPRRANWRLITPGYVEALQIPLIRGRLFDARDGDGAPLVMLVNETAARRYWQGRDPIGSRARLGGMRAFATVVGVIGDVRHQGPEKQAVPEAFFSFTQSPFWLMSLVVRTESEPAVLMPALRQQLREIDKDLPPVALDSMRTLVEKTRAPRRFLTSLVLGFAALALLLAGGGVYAQLAYSVSQRRHELGVRMALGARRAQVVGLVMRQGLGLALLGMMLGLVATAGLSRAIQQLLFGVEPLDPATLAAAPAVLLVAAAIACALPAVRAARVDPAVALRHE